METSNVFRISLDDIIFADRNKLYGAYLLRKLYNRHITYAAIMASSLFIVLISMPLVARMLEPETVSTPKQTEKTTGVILTPPPPIAEPILPPPPPPPQAKQATPPPLQATIKYSPPVVKRDAEVQHEEEIPDVASLIDVNVGTKTVEGVKGGIPDMGIPEGTGTAEITDVVDDKPYTYAEQMPSFPGGERAMFAFLAKHMKYPQQAINAGIEGQVFVSFVVSRTGDISEIQVLRGLGAGCDEEAVRVIQSMPKWTPGKQNGNAVPVRYNLPIKFTLK
ncbi:energy transducer TonB [Botryobacter ruber]|uniref:energy transducer TonB n=1 Tax=Botryobacter ruber TaxID=2171629 RepID=UPI000E0C2597|nr:energy transducer TonB [Botryobacter ruber]